MKFNSHSEAEGRHSVLSASSHAWVRYEPEKMAEVFRNRIAAARGTELHEFAAHAIKLRIKLPDTTKTLNAYVNDCIGFNMRTEQVLYYSDNAFGTADAIRFVSTAERPLLMIFDLKTGVTPASMEQLIIYVAYFCLEYGFRPAELDIELRIYQNDEVDIWTTATHDNIVHEVTYIMQQIISFDRLIEELKIEEFGR